MNQSNLMEFKKEVEMRQLREDLKRIQDTLDRIERRDLDGELE